MAPGSDGGEATPGGQQTHNFKSILDVEIWSADTLPFEPPIADYLEESLMGLRGSPHDVKTRHAEPRLRRSVDHLFAIVHNRVESVRNACTQLFFIALALVFGRTNPEFVESMRGNLARHWHVMLLEASKEIPEDLEMRNWAITALPMVLVQAIYRLLIDSFPLDRSQFVTSSGPVLDKLMQLVHFETAGFQMQTETARKERRRLFLKYVLNNPHVSLEELEKDQRRQEMLESQNKTQGEQPLCFGSLHRATMENKQLKHLLEIREENRIARQAPPPKDFTRSSIGTPAPAALGKTNPAAQETTKPGQSAKSLQLSNGNVERSTTSSSTSSMLVTGALGVDRYEGLAERGAEIHRRQLKELAVNLGEMDEEEEEQDNDSSLGGSQASRPGTATGRESEGRRALPMEGWASAESKGSSVKFGTLPASHRPQSQGGKRESTKSRSSNNKKQTAPPRMSIRPGRRQSVNLSASDVDKAEEKHSKARKDMVLSRISAPLPQELCTRKVSTSWVSPALTRLYGDDGDRNVLRKSPSEAFSLEMHIPTLPNRPASAPRKVPAKSFDVTQRPVSQGSTRRMACKDDAGSTGMSLGASCRSPAHGMPHAMASPDSAHNSMASNKRSVFARVPSAGPSNDHCETITMEMKPTSMKTTMQRLEQMSKQFRQQAFGEYMKEYDIFTGDKKTRQDQKSLEAAEQGYVRDMNKLVGGRVLGVDPFSKGQKTRMAQVAAASGPPKPSEAQQRQMAEAADATQAFTESVLAAHAANPGVPKLKLTH